MDNCTEKKLISSEMFKELMIVAMLVMSYVTGYLFLTLLAFAIACYLVVFSNEDKSMYYLAFFTSYAGIFVYNKRHMFFVMIGLFVMKSFIKNRISKNTLVFYLAILIYTLCFCDVQGSFTFAKFMGLILLFAVPVIAYSSDKIDSKIFMQHYIFGFVLATIVGFFIKYIPSMYELFDVDLMWTKNYQELIRFFGLAYDSNFYALSNYVIIAYLLFNFEKINKFRGVLILFLIISGMQTISKSYILIVSALAFIYLVTSVYKIKHTFTFIAVAVVGVVVFLFISEKMGYNTLELIGSRFVWGGNFADNTTGRTEIWKYYGEKFDVNGIKTILFGFGANANVDTAAHNTYIELAYHYGIIGEMIWFAYFVHCFRLFKEKAMPFERKSPIACICLLVGIFFLSAYTYESFWIAMVIGLMSLKTGKEGDKTQCTVS